MRLAALALCLAFIAACGNDISTPDGAAAEMTDVMDEWVSVLEGVETTDDVDSAKAEMKDLAGRMKAIYDSYNQMSKEDKAAFDKKGSEVGSSYKSRFKDAMKGKPMEVQMKLGLAMMDAIKEAGDGGTWMK